MTIASIPGDATSRWGFRAKAAVVPPAGPHAFLLPLMVASGVLLWASFYPANQGWLAWFALVPFLSLVRIQSTTRRIYGAALIYGLVFFMPALQWMRVADPGMYILWPALALYCALYFPLAIRVLRFLERRARIPLVLSLPVVWTALEFLRAYFLSGFPWYYLAHTQHDFVPMIQVSDITGAYGLSFLVAAVNAVVFEFLWRTQRFRQYCKAERQPICSGRNLGLQVLGVLASLGACLGYGLVRQQVEFEKGPVVLLMQPNVPQQIRNDAYVEANQGNLVQRLMTEYRDSTQQSLNREEKTPALVVWPESSLPEVWLDPSEEFIRQSPRARLYADESQFEVRRLARLWHTNFLVGGTALEITGDRKEIRFNTAIMIHSNGEVAGRYNKIHRVPFGEYVPFVDWLPWIKKLMPYDFDYSVNAGSTLNRFTLGKQYSFGVLICYEDTDPTLARRYVLPDKFGAPVNFLVNISNDGWFDGTSQHDQHLATACFRAVEARRAVARSVNMGISAVIDGNGRVVALPGPSVGGSKKIAGDVCCSIPIDSRHSYYAVYGDWFPWTCWGLLAAGLAYAWMRRTTSSSLSLTS